jgi:multidrug efflux pump subunit AcrB
VKTAGGTTTYLRDVAQCATASRRRPTSCARTARAACCSRCCKNGGASTLDIVANLKALLPRVQPLLPGDVKVTPLFDQSVFVKAAVLGVVIEALIAAASRRRWSCSSSATGVRR